MYRLHGVFASFIGWKFVSWPPLYGTALEQGWKGGAAVVNVEVSTTIDRPVDEVFQFVEDEANIPKWDDDLLTVTKTSDGPIGVGSTFHLDIKPFMGSSEGNGRVLNHRPNEVIELQFDFGKMKPHVFHMFEGQGSSTRFTRRVEIDPPGLMKLMQPMMKGMIRKRNVAYLQKLKQLLERNRP